MAEVHVMGEFGGPGERRTAQALGDGLPAPWVVIASKQLVRAHSTRDIDFLLIGPNLVIVCEEKAWRGPITGTTSRWVLDGGLTVNSPCDQAMQVARAVAGHVSKRVPGLAAALKSAPNLPSGQPKAVHSRVILSANPVVDVSDHRMAVEVYSLADVVERVIAFDSSYGFSIGPWRTEVIDSLLDLPKRPDRPDRIGQYKIGEDLGRAGHARQFEATHDDGSRRILRVYERKVVLLEGPAASSENNLLLREYEATKRLRATGRVPDADPYFEWDADGLLVVPMHVLSDAQPLPSVSPEQADVQAVVTDAFQALAELHQAGITHRNLAPIRVWIRPGSRVMLSDLYLARMDGSESILADAVLDDGNPAGAYLPSNAQLDLSQADQGSDVVALARILLEWALGTDWADPNRVVPEFLAELASIARAERETPTAVEAVALVSDAGTGDASGSPAPGTMLGGRYRVERNLGNGASASTWLATDVDLAEQWAVKLLHRGAVDLDKVRAEYQTLRRLKDHPGIVGVKDALLDQTPPMLIVQYIPGVTLKELAHELGADHERLRTVLLQVLDGLAYAHKNGVLHRDISATNIIVPDESAESATLIDFGLAGATADVSMVGTPRYRAPEIDAGGQWTPAADLYAVGAVFFELATGRPPYALGPDGVPRKSESVDLVAQVPDADGLTQVLFAAASPLVNDRFESAEDFAGRVISASLEIDDRTEPGERTENPMVEDLRRLYRNSDSGNQDNRGLDTEFARVSYVPTALDRELTPAIINGSYGLVLLSGNPGDGKTAYLERLKDELTGDGAAFDYSDAAGWQCEIGGRRIRAVFDASESHEGLSADELLAGALDPLLENGAANYTAVVAANDGRLVSFFESSAEGLAFAGLWAEAKDQMFGGASTTGSSRVRLVDLKERALTSLAPDEPSIALAVLGQLTRSDRWEACAPCASRHRCPTLHNARSLDVAVADGPAARLQTLTLVSHLRRRSRVTLRDLRSAYAWVIAGDQSCLDIHEANEMGANPLADPRQHYSSRVFDRGGGPDLLLDEWGDLDPARTTSARLGRALTSTRALGWDRYGPRGIDERTARPPHSTAGTLEHSVCPPERRYYFEGNAELHPQGELPHPITLLPYRHLPDVLAILQSRDPSTMRDDLLRGLSRVIGAAGYAGEGVAIRTSDRSSAHGAVVKVLAAEALVLTVPSSSVQLESIPDRVVISHSSGHPLLVLTLDQLELLLRASQGTLPTNEEARGLVEDLVGFGELLARHASDEVLVIEPAGATHRLLRSGAAIEYVGS